MRDEQFFDEGGGERDHIAVRDTRPQRKRPIDQRLNADARSGRQTFLELLRYDDHGADLSALEQHVRRLLRRHVPLKVEIPGLDEAMQIVAAEGAAIRVHDGERNVLHI